jgi:hypothetical protein
MVIGNKVESSNYRIKNQFECFGIAANIDRRFELLNFRFVMKFIDELGEHIYEKLSFKIKEIFLYQISMRLQKNIVIK